MNRNDKEKLRTKIRTQKAKILQLIFPQSNYIPYFVEYFPNMDTEKGKAKIRMTWNGATAHEDVSDMMDKIIEKLETKYIK